ncbi:gamma-glutamyl-gamma-aminobutyrate hydrolase family protein [Rickettsiales bacterium]|nr:gamma-glutamyl-gamma-aminobutyrate hydrolase family protein [Rickettsiales bacterium]
MKKSNKKPIIGVTGPDNKDRLFWYFIKFAVWIAGGKAVRITPIKKAKSLDIFDGFVISGGQDISPGLYGENAALELIQYDIKRDKLEQKIINFALKNKKPLFGICRGMQIINVTMGGSLYQEVSEVFDDFLPSNSKLSKLIGRRNVSIYKNSKLFSILGGYSQYRVNSIHHQAVNKLGDNLKVVAKEKNGLVQAIEKNSKLKHPFLVAVQWHPELMLHTNSARNIFKSFIKSC